MMGIFFLISTLFLVPVEYTSAAQESSEWTWIHGRLNKKEEQEDYLKYTRRMFDFYQTKGFMKGKLVAERDLKTPPDKYVVFIGPVAAFQHPGWFDLSMKVLNSRKIEIGSLTLTARRTGIYLRNREKTRYLYSGLSLEGFKDIFTVPTGMKSCTVTSGRGRVGYEGEYHEEGLAFEELPFLDSYPSAGDLQDLTLPEGAIAVKPVTSSLKHEGLTPEFKKWLAAFVEDQRVLFVGESHWNAGVNRLFNLIVSELLARGLLRSVFLEINYSFSGFYDYYISEADDEKAVRFLETTLHPLVGSPSTLELLEILRAWNRSHPDRRVRIACLDMEWNIPSVVQHIISPYFQRVGGKVNMLDPYADKLMKSEQTRERIEKLLKTAKEKNIVGEYPFLTPAYMETVLANLWDTVHIKDFSIDRQEGIIRNVTKFSGGLFEGGLAVFKGGGWHAVKHRLDGETFYRDAAYLHEIHPKTRGKVVTLQLNALGFSFAEFASLHPAERMLSATNYNNFVSDFRKALVDGRATADAHYLLDRGGLNVFDRLVAKTGYRTGRDILRIDSIDWDRLSEIHGEAVLENRARDYDAIIYVLRSDIEMMRPRIFKNE